jgi:integrase
MPEKRIRVWVQRFKDRPNLILQWHDPFTGTRKSKSAETTIPVVAEMKRTELEYELNHGLHKEASRMSWEKFRELFEAEYVSGKRPNTRKNYSDTLDTFERLCNPHSLRGITGRTISVFVGALRKLPGYGGKTMQESTIKIRIQFLRTALNWAVKQKLLPERLHFPTVRPPKRKPQPVPVESFERLLAKSPDEQTRVFLLCAWLAGLRLNEAVALEREATDDAPYIGHDRIVFPAGFVKAVEDQWVPLDDDLADALAGLPVRGKRVFRFVDAGGRVVDKSSVSSRVVAIAKAAGVRLTYKSLRRGFGCYWAARVPAQVLQKLMRHANIKVTMDYYANVDEAAMEAIKGRSRNGRRNSQAETLSNFEENE